MHYSATDRYCQGSIVEEANTTRTIRTVKGISKSQSKLFVFKNLHARMRNCCCAFILFVVSIIFLFCVSPANAAIDIDGTCNLLTFIPFSLKYVVHVCLFSVMSFAGISMCVYKYVCECGYDSLKHKAHTR
jgi:hypothetical protein